MRMLGCFTLYGVCPVEVETLQGEFCTQGHGHYLTIDVHANPFGRCFTLSCEQACQQDATAVCVCMCNSVKLSIKVVNRFRQVPEGMSDHVFPYF